MAGQEVENDTLKPLRPLLIRGKGNTDSFVVTTIEDDFTITDIFVNQLRYDTRVSNCRFFFIIQKESMLLGNTLDAELIMLPADPIIFEEFLKHQK